jgi:DNA-binding transcriptional regulator/RsmH inhibitor MraZ
MEFNDAKNHQKAQSFCKNNDFIRRFTAGVKVVEIDSLGRLLVPKDPGAFSNISRGCFSSAVNIVEIWDRIYTSNLLMVRM